MPATTPTKSLEALQLLCAEKLPGLRRECPCGCFDSSPDGSHYEMCECDGRAWLPVTSLSEAMVEVKDAGFLGSMGWMDLDGDGVVFFFKISKDEAQLGQYVDEYPTPELAFWTELWEALETPSIGAGE